MLLSMIPHAQRNRIPRPEQAGLYGADPGLGGSGGMGGLGPSLLSPAPEALIRQRQTSLYEDLFPQYRENADGLFDQPPVTLRDVPQQDIPADWQPVNYTPPAAQQPQRGTFSPAWWSAAADEAARMGVDPDYLRRLGIQESGLQNIANRSGPGGRPTSSAFGPWQITAGTWRGLQERYRDVDLSDRQDPVTQARAAALLTRTNREALQGSLGRSPTTAELALAHFLGSGGASTVLAADRRAPLGSVIGAEAIKANPSLRGLTVGDLVGRYERHYGA